MSLKFDDLKALAAKAEAEESGEVAELHDEVIETPPEGEEETPPEGEEETPPEGGEVTPPEGGEVTPPEGEEETPPEGGEFNFDKKVKVLDSEVEIPDFLAKSVKNEEEGNQLRELFQKAHGLDHIKSKNEKLQSKLEEVTVKHESDARMLDYLDKMVLAKDIPNILKVAKITEEEVLQHAAEILRNRELTPEQRQAYNNQVDARNRAYVLELENATLRNQNSSESTQAHVQLFEDTLAKQDVQSISKIYDERVSQPGAFKKAVIDYAAGIEKQSNGQTILTPQQAIDGFVNYIKPIMGTMEVTPPAAPPAGTPPATPAKAPVVDPRTKPVIPKVSGGSKSPVKKKPQSIEDLRKIAETFETE